MRYLRNLIGQLGKRGSAVSASEPATELSVGEFLAQKAIAIPFNLLDIGAVPLEGQAEPFRRLLTLFPESRLSAVEIDPVLCARLNQNAAANVRYYPCALGRTAERRTIYQTANPICSSLYPPDERYIDLLHNLEDMRLKRTGEISTISLDELAERHDLGSVDFIKIDIQGAELEVFEGGARVLTQTLMVVSEVEFVPLYKGQPLFGDVDAFLRGKGFMLHKLLGMAGRVMKPMKVHDSTNYPVQFLWSDAAFVRDLFALDQLTAEQQLKLAVLLDLYESKDAALYVLRHHDQVHATQLAPEYTALLPAGGRWKTVA